MSGQANAAARDRGAREYSRQDNLPNSPIAARTQAGLPEHNREYVLASLRSAVLHHRLIVTEAETIGISLKYGLLSPEAAMLWARDIGVLDLVGDQDIEAAAAP